MTYQDDLIDQVLAKAAMRKDRTLYVPVVLKKK